MGTAASDDKRVSLNEGRLVTGTKTQRQTSRRVVAADVGDAMYARVSDEARRHERTVSGQLRHILRIWVDKTSTESDRADV